MESKLESFKAPWAIVRLEDQNNEESQKKVDRFAHFFQITCQWITLGLKVGHQHTQHLHVPQHGGTVWKHKEAVQGHIYSRMSQGGIYEEAKQAQWGKQRRGASLTY